MKRGRLWREVGAARVRLRAGARSGRAEAENARPEQRRALPYHDSHRPLIGEVHPPMPTPSRTRDGKHQQILGSTLMEPPRSAAFAVMESAKPAVPRGSDSRTRGSAAGYQPDDVASHPRAGVRVADAAEAHRNAEARAAWRLRAPRSTRRKGTAQGTVPPLFSQEEAVTRSRRAADRGGPYDELPHTHSGHGRRRGGLRIPGDRTSDPGCGRSQPPTHRRRRTHRGRKPATWPGKRVRDRACCVVRRR